MHDALGNGFAEGGTVVGFGLTNAGRYCTILKLGRSGRALLREHLTGREFWTFVARAYRVVVD